MTSVQIRRVGLLMLVVLAVLVPLALLSPVLAQDKTIAGEPFGGVDVIFIVDQSVSMEGCPDYYTDFEKCKDLGHPHPHPNELPDP